MGSPTIRNGTAMSGRRRTSAVNRISGALALAFLLLLAGCGGAAVDPSPATGTPTDEPTPLPTTTGSPTPDVTPCVVTDETRTGDIRTVDLSVRDGKVSLWTGFAAGNVTELDATLDGERLFRAHPLRSAGTNVSGWGETIGAAPLSGRLEIELVGEREQTGRYSAAIACER